MSERRKRILVVEPNGDWRDLIAFVLGGCGYEVIIAKADLNVTDQAAAARPDLVLLDIGRDAMRIHAVIRELKINPLTRELPVIAETVRGEEECAREASTAGAEAVLYKPYDLGDLPLILRQNLRT
jgi:CheY-like chemotaxis protein